MADSKILEVIVTILIAWGQIDNPPLKSELNKVQFELSSLIKIRGLIPVQLIFTENEVELMLFTVFKPF